MERTRNPASSPLIVAIILVAVLAAYVSAYYLMGTVGSAGAQRLHVYPTQWQATLFTPAAKVESLLLGREVGTAYRY